MIEKVTVITSNKTNPYRNLALEKYLLLHVEKGEIILYLWQNSHTVVIGRNQNAWKECRIDRLKKDGGHLVRRLSGGGAVFHDLGNLNFTFLVRKDDYDVDKQLRVILRAVQMLGIRAEKTGRNDITVSGRKFSGNAFYETRGCCYHHGTLMVDVQMQELTKYLNVSAEKLKSKGVDSVRSRVANLTDYNPGITVGMLHDTLVEAFAEVYGQTPQPYPVQKIDKKELIEAEKTFSSREWIFGRKIPFDFEMSRRFSWGDLTVELAVNEGCIENAAVYSDAMDQQLICALPEILTHVMFDKKAVCDAVARMAAEIKQDEQKTMVTDICRFIEEQNI